MASARLVALAALAVVCRSLLGLASAADDGEVRALLELKAALDPTGRLLPSWAPGRDPCARGGFEGVACDGSGAVANVSLQGKGLAGTLSPAVAGLRALTGLYLHYNALRGGVPRELARLTRLTDVYLNVNNLSGPIPAEIGAMASLQVLQLCYNQLTGSIPTQLGLPNRLTVLALQSNHLNGAIPASLGDLPELRRLDLSFNHLFGSIPVRLARLPQLAALDVRNNSLTGSVPSELAKLEGGFQYGNNSDLCGTGLPDLRPCTPADLIDPDRPQPLSAGIAPQITPDGARGHCSGTHCPPSTKALAAVVVVAVILLAATAAGLLAFSWHRWRKQRTAAGAPPMTTSRAPTLVSLEYSNGWDPLADGRSGVGFSHEVSPSLRFNMEEVESATQYFSELNLLGKKNSKSKGGAGSSFAATYRGTLRDGTPVVVTRLGKTCCKQEEAEFLKGLKLLAELQHDNIVGLRGFCCSRARGECFLVHDFVPNGSLSHFLDVAGEDGGGGALGHGGRVLEWSTRVSIIKGIAKVVTQIVLAFAEARLRIDVYFTGIGYLHSTRANKPPLVHQNISADKVLVDYTYKPLISGSGLHKLLVDDLVFSTLKASAAMGYLAPEYTTVGRFSEKSDVYAFGVIVFQILAGKSKTMQLPFESGNVHDLIDGNMKGCYSATEAAKLAKIALVCTSENPEQRPNMEELLQELDTL
uniref:Leucine-rich repeat receptor protein kinase EXS n=1 Tax=Aegilops tauschii TaxID=37682 RepID=M8ASJ9_AEGTA